MEINEPVRIGSPVTIKVLRDYILDNGVTANDTLVLHSANFRELVQDQH